LLFIGKPIIFAFLIIQSLIVQNEKQISLEKRMVAFWLSALR